jgi:hypothetical protein
MAHRALIKQRRLVVDISSMTRAAAGHHRLMLWLVTVSCGALFIGLHVPQVIDDAYGSSFVSGTGEERAMVVLAIAQLVVIFVGLSLPGVLLAREGVRRWWWVPAAAYLLLPDLHGHFEPRPIMGSDGFRWGSAWLVAAADLALVLLLGAVVAMRTARRSSTVPLGSRVGAVVIVAGGVVLWGTNVAIAGKDPSDVGALVAIVTFSALWDVRTIGRAAVFIGITAVMTGTIPLVLVMFLDPFAEPSLRGFESHLLEESLTVPAMLSLGIGPIARVLARMRDRHGLRRTTLPAASV